MITADDIKQYINTSGGDFTHIDFQSAIALAYKRYKDITGLQTVDDSDEVVKKVLILLAISELSLQVNLYWRGKENTEVIRTKDVIAEVERLLKLSPCQPIKFVGV